MSLDGCSRRMIDLHEIRGRRVLGTLFQREEQLLIRMIGTIYGYATLKACQFASKPVDNGIKEVRIGSGVSRLVERNLT